MSHLDAIHSDRFGADEGPLRETNDERLHLRAVQVQADRAGSIFVLRPSSSVSIGKSAFF